MLPSRNLHIGICTNSIEYKTHSQTTCEYAQHNTPACNACEDEQQCAQCDSNGRCFTNTAGDSTDNSVAHSKTRVTCLGKVSQCSCTAMAISIISKPYILTRNRSSIREEDEGTSNQCGVEDIHTCTTKHLFTYNNRECCCQSNHPQRGTYGNNHRNQKTGNKETLINLLFADLCRGKLDSQSNNIRNNDDRQHFEETIPEVLHNGIVGATNALVTYVEHSEQQSRKQRENHNNHHTFDIVTVAHVSTFACTSIGNIQEGLECVECRVKCGKFTTLLKRRFNLIN